MPQHPVRGNSPTLPAAWLAELFDSIALADDELSPRRPSLRNIEGARHYLRRAAVMIEKIGGVA